MAVRKSQKKAPAKKAVKKTESGKGYAGDKADKREKLRKNLLEHRKKIIREAKEEIAKFIKGETKQLVDTAVDDGDWSMVDLSEDINLRKLSTHKETLNKIDEALRKLNEGSFGICEDCGAVISEVRLRIIPFAVYWIDCMESRERMEEFEKGEEY